MKSTGDKAIVAARKAKIVGKFCSKLGLIVDHTKPGSETSIGNNTLLDF